MTQRPLGRRETKKRADKQRILDAATRLFESKPYEEVTTAELAEMAGVSTGTLFRHIGTKADILIEVMVRVMGDPITVRPTATDHDSAVEAIATILGPFLRMSLAHPSNALALQREVIYGESSHARQFISYIQSLAALIGEILQELRDAGGMTCSDESVHDLAHAVYASLFMDFLQVATGRHEMSDLPIRMERSVRTLLEIACGQVSHEIPSPAQD